jgi:hypothetical protein
MRGAQQEPGRCYRRVRGSPHQQSSFSPGRPKLAGGIGRVEAKIRLESIATTLRKR